MKILVTGGAGFIGSNFIHYYLSSHAKDEIVNFDKLTYAGNLHNLDAVASDSRYTFIRGDITDARAVDAAMQGVSVVVHFAAESHVDRSIENANPFVVTNVVGTNILLESARKNNVSRFHHISTDEVYGSLQLHSSEKFNEHTSYQPRSPYSASKAGSDHLVSSYFHTYGLPITISHCSNNFGPYQFPEKLIPLAIVNSKLGKKIPLYGDGKNVRDWLFVEDHCIAIDTILQKGTIGETYCIGGMTEDIDNLTVLTKILALMNKDVSNLAYVPDRLGHDRRYAVDWTKMNKQFGWKPQFDFDTYLYKTVQWYLDNEKWWKQILDGSYLTT